MFEEYRNAYDEMMADEEANEMRKAIQKCRDDIEHYNNVLSSVTEKYHIRMDEAEKAIKDAVLKQENSVTLHDVYAKFTKGRVTTSWKKVAYFSDAPQEIIDANTKQGKPSVSVSVLVEEE